MNGNVQLGAKAEKLPHNYQAILKDADGDFDIDKYSSMPTELLYKQLEDGVFLKQKRQASAFILSL